jgi:hypothetical protein
LTATENWGSWRLVIAGPLEAAAATMPRPRGVRAGGRRRVKRMVSGFLVPVTTTKTKTTGRTVTTRTG